jgi:hypothetical protein
MDVVGSSHAVAVADFEASHTEPIANFNVTSAVPFSKRNVSTFCKTLESHQTHATVFVGEIGPEYVIEYVRLDRVDCKRQCGKPLRP